MKFPRLRVRQLIFLVVYVALIASALQLSLSGRVVTYPSSISGYVWAAESDVDWDEMGLPRAVVSIRRSIIDQSSFNFFRTGETRLMGELMRNPDLGDGRWLLVPEDSVR